jgi:dienelactone hydrolase
MSGTVALAANAPQRDSIFRFAETPGPHQVGLRVVEQYDYSRVFRYSINALGKPERGERARPLQTLIWYPAELTHGLQMTVADYTSLCATETHFGNPRTSERAAESLSGLSASLTTPLFAVRDAPLKTGQFPVVVYAPSFSARAWENADLCEYLASFGYIVLASPSMGSMTRNMTYDVAGINAQARDISFLVGYAGTMANTDASAICVLGYSWGAIANVFAAARDNRIGALIALDGSLRYSPGLVRQAGDVHPDRLTIPLLSIAQGQWTLEDQDRYIGERERDGPNVLNAWIHGDLIEVYMLELAHGEFASMYQRDEESWQRHFEVWHQKRGGGRENAVTGYTWLARYTRKFLDAYLKGDQTATSFLKATPAENGVPAHTLVTESRDATGTAASLEGLRAQIARHGFERIAESYAVLRETQPNFVLDAEFLIAWSEELMDGGNASEALALLEFAAQLHSRSSRIYIRLGDAYLQCGTTPRALESYKRVESIDPRDQEAVMEARRKLKGLQGRPVP